MTEVRHTQTASHMQRMLAGLCAMLATAPSYAVTRYYDTELSYVHEDNLGRAAASRDAVDDDFLLARGSANWLVPLTASSGVLASVASEYQRLARWQDLSRGALSGQLSYRYKPASAFNAPWFEASAFGTVRQFQDSTLRDGGRLDFDAALGSSLSDSIEVRLAYRYSLERAWHEAVFDGEQQRVSGTVNWRIENVTCYGTLGWQRGDTVSSAAGSALLERKARAHAVDSALSDGRHRRIAYRVDADTLTGMLGFNYPLARGLALDVAALYFDADSETGAHYRGYRVTAGVLYRF